MTLSEKSTQKGRPKERSKTPVNQAYEYLINLFDGKIHDEDFSGTLDTLLQAKFGISKNQALTIIKHAKYDVSSRSPETNNISQNNKMRQPPIFRVEGLNEKDLQILKSIFEKPAAYLAFKETTIPKATFYRRLKKLVANGILIRIDKGQKLSYARYAIQPGILEQISQEKVLPEYESQDKLLHNSSETEVQKPEIDHQEEKETKSNETRKSDELEISLDPGKVSQKNETNYSQLFEILRKKKLKVDKIDPTKIRTHRLVFYLLMKKQPVNLKYLLSKSVSFTEIKGFKHSQPFSNSKGLKTGTLSRINLKALVRFDKHKVTVAIPEILGNDAYLNVMQGLIRLMDVKEKLENEFPGLVLEPELSFQMVKSRDPEHAIQNTQLARDAVKYRISLKGNNIQIDRSNKTPEMEYVNPLQATEHVTKEFNDYEWRAENDYYFTDMINDLESIKTENKNLQDQVTLILSQFNTLKHSISDQLKEMEDILKVRIDNEGLLTRLELEKQANERLKFESGLLSMLNQNFVKRNHHDKDVSDSLLLIADTIRDQRETLQDQQDTLNSLSTKIMKKSLLEKIKDKLDENKDKVKKIWKQ